MALPLKDTEALLAYCESEQSCVLVIESPGVYGSKRASDGVKTLTAQTLALIGSHNVKVHPRIKTDYTG